MNLTISLGSSLTERQERQLEATERAAEILRAAGLNCKVTYLVAGAKFPKSDSAMITIEAAE